MDISKIKRLLRMRWLRARVEVRLRTVRSQQYRREAWLRDLMRHS